MSIAMGVTFVAAMSAAPMANADTNPFGMQNLDSGYLQVNAAKASVAQKKTTRKVNAAKASAAKAKAKRKVSAAKAKPKKKVSVAKRKAT